MTLYRSIKPFLKFSPEKIPYSLPIVQNLSGSSLLIFLPEIQSRLLSVSYLIRRPFLYILYKEDKRTITIFLHQFQKRDDFLHYTNEILYFRLGTV